MTMGEKEQQITKLSKIYMVQAHTSETHSDFKDVTVPQLSNKLIFAVSDTRKEVIEINDLICCRVRGVEDEVGPAKSVGQNVLQHRSAMSHTSDDTCTGSCDLLLVGRVV